MINIGKMSLYVKFRGILVSLNKIPVKTSVIFHFISMLKLKQTEVKCTCLNVFTSSIERTTFDFREWQAYIRTRMLLLTLS